MSTPLHRRTQEYYAKEAKRAAEIWSAYPWMINVITGPSQGDRYDDITDWLGDNTPEGVEYRIGSAIVYGETWIGFSSEEFMKTFIEKWGGSGE